MPKPCTSLLLAKTTIKTDNVNALNIYYFCCRFIYFFLLPSFSSFKNIVFPFNNEQQHAFEVRFSRHIEFIEVFSEIDNIADNRVAGTRTVLFSLKALVGGAASMNEKKKTTTLKKCGAWRLQQHLLPRNAVRWMFFIEGLFVSPEISISADAASHGWLGSISGSISRAQDWRRSQLGIFFFFFFSRGRESQRLLVPCLITVSSLNSSQTRSPPNCSVSTTPS